MSAPVFPAPATAIPPLRNGDHLDRLEFERRFDATPGLKKAELIEGVVYMAAAVRFQEHGKPHAGLTYWLTTYWAHTPGTSAGINSSLRLDLDNEPQPDDLLMIDADRGGRATVDEDGYVAGAPELAAEVAASTVSLDRNAKMRLYRRHGVQEYVLWRVEQQAIDWFVLRGGQYEALPPGDDGILRSEVFPGLWLDAAALMRGDFARVLAVLQQGLASDAHRVFVERLSRPQGT